MPLFKMKPACRQVNLERAQRQRIVDLTWACRCRSSWRLHAPSPGTKVLPSVERWLGDAAGDLAEYCITGQVELAQRQAPRRRQTAAGLLAV